jgi:pyruvate dehydrogenase E1 component alpha subunit
MYEASSMSALWKLPVKIVCENFLYGMGTSVERVSANTKFYTRGDKVSGFTIDGSNVLAMRTPFKFAKAFVLKNGPIFMEIKTYSLLSLTLYVRSWT